MPELPEVQTTVDGINKYLPGRKILSVWSDYDSQYFKGKENIKDLEYFQKFEQNVVGKKIKSAERKGKNIIIHLSGNMAVVIHMKMTGHLLYGRYRKVKVKGQKSSPKANQPLAEKVKSASQNSKVKTLKPSA